MSENAPLGADQDKRAPWNQEKPETVKCEMLIIATVEKAITVELTSNHHQHDLYKAMNNALHDVIEQGFDIIDKQYTLML